MEKRIIFPLSEREARTLQAGDRCLISGEILTGRDAAHKRFSQALKDHVPLPIDLRDQALYFVGPTPAKPNEVIGSAGPTTSGRMDKWSPELIAECGLRAMIGKGARAETVIDAMKEYGCIYFAAIGGAGALLSKCIKKVEVLCYDDLGTEAVRRLTVENFPVIVAIDSQGNNLYKMESP